MNAEQFHDAISLLPGDLIAEADKKRAAKPAPPRWQRYAAMAACLALMVCGSLWCFSILGAGGAKEAAAEAPAAMQAAVTEKALTDRMLPEPQAAAENAPMEYADAEEAEDTCAQSNTASVTGGGTGSIAAVPQVTVTGESGTLALTQEGKHTLAQLLADLVYLPENVCECIAEITVTMNGETRFHINLEEGFVRCSEGQAILTQTQVDTLQQLFFPE